MAKYLSQNELGKLYRENIKKYGDQGVKEIISEQRSKSSEHPRNTIFLSHSHHDKTIVEKMILLFQRLNCELYIDWMDESMPITTTQETARLIKEKIEKSKKVIFLATYYAIKSKWCNWELGIADSLKTLNGVAILPIESRNGNWHGSEYLGLYPIMAFDNLNMDYLNIEEIFIESDNSRIQFQEWIEN
jgi:hypothetical protein